MTDEDRLQFAICEFLGYATDARRVVWHSIPNGLPSKPRTIIRFKKLGLRPGVGDLQITVDGRTHYLEVKTPEGRQSTDQRAFELQCESAGIPYRICRSLDEAKAILSEWGALRQPSLQRAA